MEKRLRVGAELQLFDEQYYEMAVRGGRAYAGRDRNKRQILTLKVDW